MRPHFLALIIGKTACVHRKTDFRLVAIVRSKSASERSSMPRVIAIPALLIRMSIVPNSDFAVSTILETASASETSAWTVMTFTPVLRRCSANLFASSVRTR